MAFTIPITRPTACRLYSLIGQVQWIHGIAKSDDLEPEQKLEALEQFALQLGHEIGTRRLNHLQDAIYCELITKPRQQSTVTNYQP